MIQGRMQHEDFAGNSGLYVLFPSIPLSPRARPDAGTEGSNRVMFNGWLPAEALCTAKYALLSLAGPRRGNNIASWHRYRLKKTASRLQLAFSCGLIYPRRTRTASRLPRMSGRRSTSRKCSDLLKRGTDRLLAQDAGLEAELGCRDQGHLRRVSRS